MTTNEIITIWARKGAARAKCGKMCEECAFRRGTVGNRSEVSVRDAADAVAYEMSTFHCHMGDMPVCSGFLYAKAYFETIAKK